MSQTVKTIKRIASSEEYRALEAAMREVALRAETALEPYLRRIITIAFGETHDLV